MFIVDKEISGNQTNLGINRIYGTQNGNYEITVFGTSTSTSRRNEISLFIVGNFRY